MCGDASQMIGPWAVFLRQIENSAGFIYMMVLCYTVNFFPSIVNAFSGYFLLGEELFHSQVSSLKK
jgi:hypothetical protein